MKNYRGYRVTSGYGPRQSPISGKQEFHTGIDLVLSHQAPIASFTSGTVVHAQMGLTGSGFGGFGHVVAIQDEYGCLHMYAHLDQIKVGAGQRVRVGEVVGTQGNTGKSTGSHLHYEVRRQTKPSFGYGSHTDPVVYLEDYARKGRGNLAAYRDVPADHWAAPSIVRAAQTDILRGVAEDTFGLGQAVTREQLAVILDRLGLLRDEGENQIPG